METNKPGGLYLCLAPDNSEAWEEDCDWHSGHHYCDKGLEMVEGVWENKNVSCPCPYCHGTGKVKRRLVGEVAVVTGYRMVTAIIKAHRANTLPPELYAAEGRAWGLTEVTMEDTNE